MDFHNFMKSLVVIDFIDREIRANGPFKAIKVARDLIPGINLGNAHCLVNGKLFEHARNEFLLNQERRQWEAGFLAVFAAL